MGDPCYLDDDWRTIGYFSATGNTFALCSPKTIPLLTGEHGEIWGRLEVVWEKVACWSTKAAISLKLVNVEEKLLWGPIGTHLRSFERYHT